MIERIPRATFNKGQIAQIFLDGNRIQVLDCWLQNLTRLTELSVSGNNLTEFDPRLVMYNHKLKILHLTSNDLSDLNVERIVKNHKKLKKLYFDDNEISCVRAVNIIKFLDSHNVASNSFAKFKVRYYTQKGVFGQYKCNGDVEWMAANYRKNDKNTMLKLLETEKEIEKRLRTNEMRLQQIFLVLMVEINKQTELLKKNVLVNLRKFQH